MDVGIVGGGLVGVALAVALRERGARATVFERGRLGGEASTAAGGILGARTENDGAPETPPLAVLLEARAAAIEWAERLGDVDLSRRGVLRLAFSERELADDGERVDPAHIRELAPAASPEAIGGTFYADDAHVDPRKLFAAAVAEARALGAQLQEGTSVTRVQSEGAGAAIDGRRFDRVVLCTGSWLSELAPALAVRPIRGHMLELRAPVRPFGPVLLGAGVYAIPRSDGRVTIGSTVEDVGHQRAVEPARVETLYAGAVRTAPSLASAERVRAWSSFRPLRRAGLYVGPTAMPGVLALAGHHRNGILLARSSALAMTRLLLD